MAALGMTSLVVFGIALSACGPPGGPRTYRLPDPASFELVDGRLKIGDADEALRGARVSEAFFPSAGAVAFLGRLLIDRDFATAGARVVVLHHGLWQARFDGSPAVVGREVHLNGEPHTIVGITPPDFAIPDGVRFWLPRLAIAAGAGGGCAP